MGDTHWGGVVASDAFKIGNKNSSSTVIDSSENASFGGTLAVTGATTISGAVASPRPYTLLTVNTTLTAAQSGGIFGIATDAKVITLPAVASGLWYTIVNTGAAGNNLVDVAITDGVISGTFTLAGTVVVVSVATTIRNTKGTSIKGDAVTLVSDGTGWFIQSSAGIWAQQAP